MSNIPNLNEPHHMGAMFLLGFLAYPLAFLLTGAIMVENLFFKLILLSCAVIYLAGLRRVADRLASHNAQIDTQRMRP